MRFSLGRLLTSLRFRDPSKLDHTDDFSGSNRETADKILTAPIYVNMPGGIIRVEVWDATFDYTNEEIVLKLKGDRS